MKDWTVHSEPRADGSVTITEGTAETLRCVVYGADGPEVARQMLVDRRLIGVFRKILDNPTTTKGEVVAELEMIGQEHSEDSRLLELFRGMVEDSFCGQ